MVTEQPSGLSLAEQERRRIAQHERVARWVERQTARKARRAALGRFENGAPVTDTGSQSSASDTQSSSDEGSSSESSDEDLQMSDREDVGLDVPVEGVEDSQDIEVDAQNSIPDQPFEIRRSTRSRTVRTGRQSHRGRGGGRPRASGSQRANVRAPQARDVIGRPLGQRNRSQESGTLGNRVSTRAYSRRP